MTELSYSSHKWIQTCCWGCLSI